MTTAEQYLKNGQLSEALGALKQQVRDKPQDARARVFLFQLDCVLGDFQKALDQLQVLASLNADTMLLAEIFRPVLACEMLRREVFEGKRTPIIFGEPPEWVGLLVQANELSARGAYRAALELRDRAFEAAPATPGSLNGTAFEWCADADSRLGPVLEAIIQGKYYWIPFCRIQKLEVTAPSDLRDLVWAPAQFVWANGGQVAGHIPCRYPKTESASDDALRLSRKTEWQEPEPGFTVGLGQRLLTTNEGDYPLLECRTLELQPPIEPASS